MLYIKKGLFVKFVSMFMSTKPVTKYYDLSRNFE